MRQYIHSKTLKDTIGGNRQGTARPAFIFCGQSNVDGAIAIAELPAEFQGVYETVRFYNGGTTDFSTKFTAMDSSNEYTYKAGNPNPGGFYCLQFFLYPELATLLSREVFIMQHAFGGSGLNAAWKPTATVGNLYTEAVFKTLATRNLITSVDGVAPSFKFFYWGQGEKDAQNATDAGAYQTNLTNLINNFRSATGLTTLPFLIGRLNSDAANATAGFAMPHWATVRAAQEAVCEGGGSAISNVFMVDLDNAELSSDWTHYTTAGFQTISDNIITVAQAEGLI